MCKPLPPLFKPCLPSSCPSPAPPPLLLSSPPSLPPPSLPPLALVFVDSPPLAGFASPGSTRSTRQRQLAAWTRAANARAKPAEHGGSTAEDGGGELSAAIPVQILGDEPIERMMMMMVVVVMMMMMMMMMAIIMVVKVM